MRTAQKLSCLAGLVAALGFLAPSAQAVLYVNETFTHTDGNLVGKTPTPGPGGTWAAHSGAGNGPVQVTSGAAVLAQGVGAEDVNTAYNGGFQIGAGQTIYAAFDVAVTGGNADVYFAHFKIPLNTSFFGARVFVSSDIVAGGDFVFGLSGNSSAVATRWATGLTFGTTYRLVASYEYDTGSVALWVNPVDQNSTKLTATGVSGDEFGEYAFRQSAGNSTQTIDNLCVATTFVEALTCAESAALQITSSNATPNPVYQGDNALLTVSLTSGTPPYSVIGNLTALGGSATQTFFDNGTNGDVTPNDNIFSYLAAVPCNQAIGPIEGGLPVEAGDAACNPVTQACTTSSIPLTVNDGTLALGLPSPGGAAPADDGHPSNATRCLGENASFSVAAQGGGLTYQWFNGANNPLSDGPTGSGSTISGATASRMTISNVGAADAAAGPYKCTITRTCDLANVTTNAASLTIGTGATATQKQIVISQVYGGGGNSGATYTHDFIELFNKGTTAVNVGGWSVQYAGSDGPQAPFDRPPRITVLPSVSIAPGKFLLIQEAAGTGGTTPLPSPDVTGNIGVGSTDGKVALVIHSDTLSDTCPYSNGTSPNGCSIVDFVGYGAGVGCSEGANPAPGPSNSTAVIRTPECIDTDNNGNDFALGAPNPRNNEVPSSPLVVTPPADVLSCQGLTATFNVLASGGCLTYQWQVNQAPALPDFVNVSTGTGGTTPSYTTAALAAGDDGNQYRVVVSNTFGPAATSAAATLDLSGATADDKQIVISAIYGGGGNNGATFQNDYIQLINKGTTTVSVDGWSVQYAGATSVNWAPTALTGSISPGQYYLIQLAAGNSCDGSPCGVGLPAPNVSNTTNMSATTGKVALIKSTEMIPTVTCPASDCRMVDFVGYGTSATCFEGSGQAPSAANNAQAVTRSPLCSDTDQNANDFISAPANPVSSAGGSNVAADLNGDGLVNGNVPGALNDDLDLFMACQTGDRVPYDTQNLPEDCDFAADCDGFIQPDFDKDGDVDLDDFAGYQRCYNGATPQNDPNCGN